MGFFSRQLKHGVDQVFLRAKESVQRIRVTKTYDESDDVVESYSTATIDAIIQVVRLEDINEFGGLLKVGDAIGFFKADADVQVGDRIVHNGVTYEIDELHTDRVEGTDVLKEATLKRVKYV